MTIRPFAQGDHLAGFRVFPQFYRTIRRYRTVILAVAENLQLTGMFAFRIIRAADKGSELAKLQAKPSVITGRAVTRGLVFLGLREEMRPQSLIQRINDIGDCQVFCAINSLMEGVPEFVQHNLVIHPVCRNFIQLVFQIGGEIVLNIAFKKVRQEGRDETPHIFRNETAIIKPDITTVLQHGENRRIGRRTADTEFFHLLDQTGLGITWWWLCKMLFRQDFTQVNRLAFIQGRQTPVVIVSVAVVHAFPIDLEKTVKRDG